MHTRVERVADQYAERDRERQCTDAVGLKPGDLGELEGEKREHTPPERFPGAPLALQCGTPRGEASGEIAVMIGPPFIETMRLGDLFIVKPVYSL